MKTIRWLRILAGVCLTLGLISFSSVQAEENILIIAHSKVPEESLSRATISDIYLGKKTKWENEHTIHVVMLKEGALHEAFVKNIVGTTPAKLKNYWKKVVFTGTGTPPKIFKTEKELIEFITENEDTIGYISASTPHEHVKVIEMTEE